MVRSQASLTVRSCRVRVPNDDIDVGPPGRLAAEGRSRRQLWDRGPWIGPTPGFTLPVAVRSRIVTHVSVAPRPHRPVPYADLPAFIDAAGGAMLGSRAEVASATAAVLVQTGRGPDTEDGARFVELADLVGLDTLAALWRDADPISLPGALWALYLLRQWCRTSSEEVRRFWRAGEPLAPADAVVAGVAEPGDENSVQDVADAVLGGVYRGDVAVAFERAAAMFRVVAAGRRELVPDDDGGCFERELAERNERAAGYLGAAARRWRAGTLH